jgi:hypothetical protein
MNRLEFQDLAVERLGDADALLKAGRFACAYYISGYHRMRFEGLRRPKNQARRLSAERRGAVVHT